MRVSAPSNAQGRGRWRDSRHHGVRRPKCLAWDAVVLLCACGEGQGPGAAPVAAPREEVFVVEDVMQLGEDPADAIAEIGDFVGRRNGGYVIGDRFRPRVRTYDEEGCLEAAFGRFGEGPFEFQRITAVAETPSERIVVASSRASHLTYLTRSPDPDTMIALPGAPRDVLALGPDLLVYMMLGDPSAGVFGNPPLLHRMAPPEVVWSAFQLPFSDLQRPYWSSFADYSVAVGGDSAYVTSGLRYPISTPSGRCLPLRSCTPRSKSTTGTAAPSSITRSCGFHRRPMPHPLIRPPGRAPEPARQASGRRGRGEARAAAPRVPHQRR